MRTIDKLFGKSPFRPLVEHARRVHDTVERIRPFLGAYLAGDWDRCEEIRREVSRLEHEADKHKNEIRDHLPRSLFLPVDRGDVLGYLMQQDAIADATEDLTGLLTLRRIETPESLHEPILEFAGQVIRTSELLLEAGLELTDLFEASFGGPEVERVLEMMDDVNRQEHEADRRGRELCRELLAHEDGMDAVSIILWMRALDILGRVANHAENTGDLLRMMMARR